MFSAPHRTPGWPIYAIVCAIVPLPCVGREDSLCGTFALLGAPFVKNINLEINAKSRMKSSYLLAVVSTLALGAVPVSMPSPSQPSSSRGSSVGQPDAVIVLKNDCALAPIPLRVVHHHGQSAAPHIRNRNGTSSNWGGYAVETSFASPRNKVVSAVQGSWTIPTVSRSTSSQTYSSLWVGIDGYSDGTVEQIGTEQDWTPSGQQNYVWFEMYPHGAYEIVGFPIAAGDNFGAGVVYLSGGTFMLSITNVTQGVYYTVPTHYTRSKNALRSSAEWIVEAPYSGGVLPLADFGTASFSHCVATINGTTGPIDDTGFWEDDAITMQTSSGVVKAQPSALNDSSANGTTSSSFTARWHHE